MGETGSLIVYSYHGPQNVAGARYGSCGLIAHSELGPQKVGFCSTVLAMVDVIEPPGLHADLSLAINQCPTSASIPNRTILELKIGLVMLLSGIYAKAVLNEKKTTF